LKNEKEVRRRSINQNTQSQYQYCATLNYLPVRSEITPVNMLSDHIPFVSDNNLANVQNITENDSIYAYIL